MNTENPLNGKVAIITGGSTEVAGAVALALARAGVNITLCGKSGDLLALTETAIQQASGRCLSIVTELESLESADKIIGQTQAAYGQLDILILVSPFWAGGQIHAHSLTTWDRVMSANLREAFIMTRAILPHLRAQKHGEVMAIGSDSALGIYQQDGAYGVAMHALKTLLELIEAENAEFGLRVQMLAPGLAISPAAFDPDRPSLTTTEVADWVIWLLTRPAHLRGNGILRI